MRKIDAIILILGIMGVSSWIIFSGKDGFKGNNAMIVARSISVAATMEGRVDYAPPVVGSKFNANELLVLINNSRADRTRLVELESHVGYLESEISSVTSQQRELTELLAKFEKRASSYADWMQQDVQLRKLVNMRQLEVVRKRSQMKTEEVARLARLLKTQHTSEVNERTARIDADIAKTQVELATAELDRTELLLTSLQDGGIFSEDGDSNYWAKSTDILKMRFFDNRGKIDLLKAQLARTVAQVTAEREHLHTNFSEEHRAPFSGVVNARFVTQGARVASGTSLLQVLDCARPTVVIPIPEHRIGEFSVGMKATVYPIDSNNALAGKIIHISSGPLLGHDTSIQLEQSLTLDGIRAIVGFDDHGSLGALSESCEIARKAVAIIHTESLYESISEWVSAFATRFIWGGFQLHANATESPETSARP